MATDEMKIEGSTLSSLSHAKMDAISNNFRYHKPGEEVERKHESVRHACARLAIDLQHVLPPGREASVAQTKLEEVMFWANAAIARNQK